MESSGSSDKEIKIGATAGPHAEVVEAVAKEAEKQGIHSERTPAYRGGAPRFNENSATDSKELRRLTLSIM